MQYKALYSGITCQNLRTNGDPIPVDRIDLFRIFIRVVDCASFTRAAASLDMPRSSVSAAIQELEGRIGARLLHRTTRNVSPTNDGIAFYERCTRVIYDVEETENLFRQKASRPSGKIRINVPGRIGRLIVAPALSSFLTQYPDINIDIGVTDRAVNLAEDSVDCVLRAGHLVDSSLIARSIGELPLLNVAAPHYLQRYGIPDRPEELDSHLAVNYASPSTGRIEDWEWMENGEIKKKALRGRVTVNNAEAYIACCLAGLGLIQIPAYDVQSHIDSNELVEFMPAYQAQPLPLTILYPSRQHLSRRLSVFVDWLEALLRDQIR